MRSVSLFRFFVLVSFACLARAQAPADAPALDPLAAGQSPMAVHASILGSARAGQRLVAVGDHGVVLLSDDGGQHVHQARGVPVDVTLTEVSFADEQHGWAVGHWGTIIATADGGESWQIQRMATEEDRPLFSVHFSDSQHGLAVGLWSLMLATDDGGKTWTTRQLPPPSGAKKADLNLLHVFAAPGGTLYVAAERGFLLRSTDHGASWDYIATGCKGSFWTGTALSDEVLLVAGQRGEIYRSADAGVHWTQVALDSKSSLTGVAAKGQDVVAVGLDGLIAESHDAGVSFKASTRNDKLSLTAISLAPAGNWAIWSRDGLVGNAMVH